MVNREKRKPKKKGKRREEKREILDGREEKIDDKKRETKG